MHWIQFVNTACDLPHSQYISRTFQLTTEPYLYHSYNNSRWSLFMWLVLAGSTRTRPSVTYLIYLCISPQVQSSRTLSNVLPLWCVRSETDIRIIQDHDPGSVHQTPNMIKSILFSRVACSFYVQATSSCQIVRHEHIKVVANNKVSRCKAARDTYFPQRKTNPTKIKVVRSSSV